MNNRFIYLLFKRLLDFHAAFLILLFFLPLMFLITLLIKITSPGPVLYSQTRVGQRGKPFKILKFRTMIPEADQMGLQVTSKHDPRITPLGKILRKTKLDEFPQFLNVLKGDMSFVGPRPEVSKYVEIFKADYQKILEIKPGITDYATIEFRDEEEILEKYKNLEEAYINEILPQKIKLYNKYMIERSLFIDLKLIFLTLCKIVK